MDVDLKQVDRSKVKAFFMFDILVLPALVKIGFIVGVVGVLLSGITVPFRMAIVFGKFDFGAFVVGCVISAIMVPLGLVWLRIVCESMVVLFKIREDLAALRGPLPPALAPPEPEKPSAPPAPPAA